MRESVRDQLLIVVAACVILLPTLGWTGLWDMDEALYATCAREMLERGNWVVPWFNGEMFPEKPVLMFWTMIAGFKVFGVNEWGARFFSAAMGVGTALAAFHLGRILFQSARIGLWTGLITASTIVFTISARAATVDSALTFVTTLAMLFFAIGCRRTWESSPAVRGQGKMPVAAESRGSSALPHPTRPLPVFPCILMYASIGAAALAKGPVGIVLPLAAIGLFLLVANGWRRWPRSLWNMRPMTGLLVMAAVALPWYIAVSRYNHGEWLRRFLVDFNMRPFRQPIQSHGDTSFLRHGLAILVSILYYFYHIPGLLFGFFPWSVFLGPTLVDTIRRLRGREEMACDARIATEDAAARPSPLSGRLAALFAVCWLGVWFVFWSICKTKLPHYLLPAYPALAMLTACWMEKKSPFASWELRNAWISTILVGLGIMIAVPIFAWFFLPGEAMLGGLGIVLILGGAWCWRVWKKGEERTAVESAFRGYAVMSIVFLSVAFNVAALGVDRHQNAKPMIAAIRADWARSTPDACPTAQPPIATYRFFRESTVYYAGRPVARCDNDVAEMPAAGRLAAFLAEAKQGKSPAAYVITTNEYESEIQQAFPGVFHVIFRQPRFLATGEMVVLRAAIPRS